MASEVSDFGKRSCALIVPAKQVDYVLFVEQSAHHTKVSLRVISVAYALKKHAGWSCRAPRFARKGVPEVVLRVANACHLGVPVPSSEDGIRFPEGADFVFTPGDNDEAWELLGSLASQAPVSDWAGMVWWTSYAPSSASVTPFGALTGAFNDDDLARTYRLYDEWRSNPFITDLILRQVQLRGGAAVAAVYLLSQCDPVVTAHFPAWDSVRGEWALTDGIPGAMLMALNLSGPDARDLKSLLTLDFEGLRAVAKLKAWADFISFNRWKWRV